MLLYSCSTCVLVDDLKVSLISSLAQVDRFALNLDMMQDLIFEF